MTICNNFEQFFNNVPNYYTLIPQRCAKVSWSFGDALCLTPDKFEKVTKLFVGLLEGYEAFIDKVEPASLGISLMKGGAKLITGTALFSTSTSDYWMNRVKLLEKWNNNSFEVCTMFVLHTGSAFEFMKLSTDLGVGIFAAIGAEMGKVPLLAPLINIGLSSAKNWCVVIGSLMTCAVVIYTIATRKGEMNQAFVDEQLTKFISNLCKAVAVAAVIFLWPYDMPIFLAGLMVGLPTVWKYLGEQERELIEVAKTQNIINHLSGFVGQAPAR